MLFELFWILSQNLVWSELFLCNNCGGRFEGSGKILSNKKVAQSASSSAHARNWVPMMYGGRSITIALLTSESISAIMAPFSIKTPISAEKPFPIGRGLN